MKPKKPARIKGDVQYSMSPVEDEHGLTIRFVDKPKYLRLLIDNPDALVEQVSKAMFDEERKHSVGPAMHVLAIAALRSIGVPLKK